MPSRKDNPNRDMHKIEGKALDERGTNGTRIIDDKQLQDFLNRASSFAYSEYVHSSGAQMTCRAEKRRNGVYWYGYHHNGKKLHNVYLGKAETITFDKLKEAARKLQDKAKQTA